MGLIIKELVGSEDNFWNAVKIYCRHPNSINKEVLYSEIVCFAQIELRLCEMECQELCNKLYDHFFVDVKDTKDVINMLQNEGHVKLLDNPDVFTKLNGNYFMMRKLLPKRTCYSNKEFYEICFIDTGRKIVRFYSLFNRDLKNFTVDGTVMEYDPYVIAKYSKIIVQYHSCYLNIEYNDDLSEKGLNWINSVFVTKLIKIMFGINQNKAKITFSSQVDVVSYYKLYEELKLKYAKNLIENWSEKTDPQKFVFEDIGIATYLLLLWNRGELPSEKSKKQRFVDLGCGNGLLVYILNSEGHNGVGLDLRKRKIWDTYPSNVVLKEEAVVPGPSSTYPNADWLIGNHSDELTPWLPLMARKSGPNCQYFVLPCCPYQLNGHVYQRKNSGLSVYHDFIKYIQGISEICQFDTRIDKLRIPSTKRICIIGRKKNMTVEEVDNVQQRIDAYIIEESQRGVLNRNINSDKWLPDFKVREPVEAVRNCTKLPRELIKDIITSIANHLLKEINILKVVKETGTCEWNQGGSMAISKIADALSPHQLKYLKKECKGLQTLIKNHHYVFHVSGGVVRFRNDQEMMQMSRGVLHQKEKFKWKEKECWFFANHPDGCPLRESVCSYKHG